MPFALFSRPKPKTPAEQALDQAKHLLDTATHQAEEARDAAGKALSQVGKEAEHTAKVLGEAAQAGREQALANLNQAARTLRHVADGQHKSSAVPWIAGLVVAGAAIGVGAWLLMEPNEGPRRREMLKDYGNMARDFSTSVAEFAATRVRGEG